MNSNVPSVAIVTSDEPRRTEGGSKPGTGKSRRSRKRHSEPRGIGVFVPAVEELEKQDPEVLNSYYAQVESDYFFDT